MARARAKKQSVKAASGANPTSIRQADSAVTRKTVIRLGWEAYRRRRPAAPVHATVEDIGKTIRLLRLASGWSQTDLAAKAGLPQATISGLESGRSLTLTNLAAVAGAFAMSSGDLLKATERRLRATGPQQALLAVADKLAEGFDPTRLEALVQRRQT